MQTTHEASPSRPTHDERACYDCECYKGKVCAQHTAPLESTVSLDDDGTSSETTATATAKLSPFTVEWVYGRNVEVPVLNLTRKGRSAFVYAGSHCCAVYDYGAKTAGFLTGFQNKITAISCEASGNYVAVSDSGPDNIITVWDTTECVPLTTIFKPHGPQSVATLCMSPDGKYLVSVSAGSPSCINMWKWTTGAEEPEDSLHVKPGGAPIAIAINPNVTEHIMVAFQRQVTFVTWNAARSSFEEPITPEVRKQKHLGTITGCTYIDRCHDAVACTNEGCILVFGNTLYTQRYEEAEPRNRKIFVKTIRVTSAVINHVATVDGLIVTGDENGNVKFYDKAVKLLYWYQSFKLPSICSISFDLDERFYELRDPRDFKEEDFLEGYEDRSEEYEIIYNNMVPRDFTYKAEPFVARDFIASTSDGGVYRIDYVQKSCESLYREADDVVAGIDVHDEKPLLLIAYANGRICMYNYETHEREMQFILPTTFDDDDELVTTTYIKFSAQALHLACSRSNGEIWLLDPTLLTPKYKTPLQSSKCRIERVDFSQDSKCMAYYDSERTVGLYKYCTESNVWICFGKTRAHYLPISEMLFSPYSPTRLFTIGQDRQLIEYNLECPPGDFSTFKAERIEQSAVPVTFVYHPEANCKRKYFLMSDNQFKYKKINDSTGMCHSVVLGPAYGCYKSSPVCHMTALPQHDDRYFIFATERHVGIQMLPADGNPFKYLGIVGHPIKIKGMRASKCGRLLFTTGENDRTVIAWNVQANSVDSLCALGGTVLEPYYCLIEGGRGGWLFAEMQDLFYYMQILYQGENTITRRVVSDFIPIDELPDLMRACGYYLSEFEAENLVTDITYRDFDVTGRKRRDVSFVEFVQLYVNHRPAHGVSYKQMESAFGVILDRDGDHLMESIHREEFAAAFCKRGEQFEPGQVHKYLCALMGEAREFQPDGMNFTFLPININFETFIEEILGIDLKKPGTGAEEPGEATTSYFAEYMGLD